ncbi:hypothetical protein ACN20G_10835 [Streptomyces sp. BI20]|uniref:hypothetical protein n=1 Tax=Streptomyces sp. BI20 TaxID=3403460 RepID=UPI003C765808
MAIADDLKKTLTDPTPLYFAAGTAELAARQARKVPGLIEQLRAEAPGRIEAVRNTDPKVVQERAKAAGDVVSAKVAEVLGALEPDLRKLGETAQDLALRGVGVAAEYAVRAKETYDRVAEQGEQAVRTWRGEVVDEIVEIAEVVEPDPVPVTEPAPEPAVASAEDVEGAEDGEKPAAKKPAARRAGAKKTAAEPVAEGAGSGQES